MSTATQQKKTDKRLYWLLITGMVLGVIYHYFLRPHTIHHTVYYRLITGYLPVSLGMIAWWGLLKSYYRGQWLDCKTRSEKIFVIIFIFLQLGVLSLFTFGLATNIITDIILKNKAEDKPVTTVSCRITEFRNMQKSDAVYFKFREKTEKIEVSNQWIQAYQDESPDKYLLMLNVQETYLDVFLIKDWHVVPIE